MLMIIINWLCHFLNLKLNISILLILKKLLLLNNYKMEHLQFNVQNTIIIKVKDTF